MTTAHTRLLAILPLVTMLLGASACTVHRLDIRQGNFVSYEQLDQLEEDMTREQVRFLLGTPLLESSFRSDRWDYLYYLDSRRGDDHEVYLVVWFDGDRVANIETRRGPTWSQSGDGVEAEVDLDDLEQRDAPTEPPAEVDTGTDY